MTELFTGFKKPESSFSNAELTMSGLLNGSPLPNGITLRLFSMIFYALHTVAPNVFPAPLWGGRSVVLATS